MVGYRKLVLGITYLIITAGLTFAGIRAGTDLVSLSSTIAIIGGGLFGVIYGNVKEHQANNK